jgi:hypothetical protein
MNVQHNELNLRAELMMMIDRYRIELGNPDLGTAIERAILEANWRELDRDIAEDPGALECELVRLRRRRA